MGSVAPCSAGPGTLACWEVGLEGRAGNACWVVTVGCWAWGSPGSQLHEPGPPLHPVLATACSSLFWWVTAQPLVAAHVWPR